MSAIAVERLLTWTNRARSGVAHHVTALIFYNMANTWQYSPEARKACADSDFFFCQRWSNFFNVFSRWWERGSKYYLKGAIIDPLACRWWPNIDCWLGRFCVIQWIRTSIAKKLFIFCVLEGEGFWTLPPPPLCSAHERAQRTISQNQDQTKIQKDCNWLVYGHIIESVFLLITFIENRIDHHLLKNRLI